MTRKPVLCECGDPGCPECQGQHRQAQVAAFLVAFRVDMDDSQGVAFCQPCWDDAGESGLFGEARLVEDYSPIADYALAPVSIWKDLTVEETERYRLWARANWSPGDPIQELWHPVVRDEIARIQRGD